MNTNLQQRLFTLLNNNARDNENTDTENTTTEETEQKDNIYGIEDRQKYVERMTKNLTENASLDKLNTNIFGIPHQFLATTDSRIDNNNNFGYGFFNHIYIERPIVTLMPGKMLFLPAFSKSNKKIFGSLSGDLSNANSQKALAELISEEAGSRYYDFEGDYTAYMNYVNLMCRVCAVYLGIEDMKAPDDSSTYKTYDWKNYHSIEGYKSTNADTSILSDVKDFFKTVVDDVTVGQRCYVNFYIDPNTTVNESISNTTQASQLEGMFDSVEGIVKEAQMLLNTVGGSTVQSFLDSATSKVEDLANAATLGVFSNLLGLGKEVLNGSNLIYPEIWTESNYDKHFSIQINLASPYGTKEAIYLNILVPMLHALCLALPRQSSENSYNAPFLIRGYCQGWFSIDMGMVESISIDKGPEQSWNVEGLPTQMKITLSIKELYGNLMMSPSTRPSWFFSNQGLIDYLGVACGVDMTIPSIYFNYRLASSMLGSYFKDIPNRIYYSMCDNVRGFLSQKFNF